MRDMVGGLSHRLPHQSGRANGEVEPGIMVHLQARANAMTGFADEMPNGAAEFDFRRRVRLVAGFVLQPLNLQPVPRSVREPASDDETRDPFLGLRERQENVGVWDREEPLVADERPRAVAVRLGAGLGLPQVRAALFLRHRHADGRTGLIRSADLPPIVFVGLNEIAPFGPARRVAAQDRNRRIGHADRAADAVLALIPQVRKRGTRDLGAGTRLGPSQRMRLLPDGERHQFVPGRMKVDAIGAIAEAVMRAQFRNLAVCLAR